MTNQKSQKKRIKETLKKIPKRKKKRASPLKKIATPINSFLTKSSKKLKKITSGTNNAKKANKKTAAKKPTKHKDKPKKGIGKITKKITTESPNLLRATKPALIRDALTKHHFTYATFAKIVIVGIQIIFIIALGLNLKLETQIQDLEEEVANYETQLYIKQKNAEEIQDIIYKLEKLKQLKDKKLNMRPVVETYLSKTIGRAVIKNVTFKRDVIETTLTTDTILQSALMMAEYLDSDNVDSIVLESAVYNPTFNKFTMELEINFK